MNSFIGRFRSGLLIKNNENVERLFLAAQGLFRRISLLNKVGKLRLAVASRQLEPRARQYDKYQADKASMIALGFSAAILSNAFAGPRGCLRPCSQF